jgi:cation diffusion facilitator CzcD-associated flavoprotein CzcO
MIAVGGRAGRLSVPGAELGLTYQDVRGLAALPDRVCVIGAADTGCQLASILADFGCQVSLIEYAPRIVPRADQDISAALERAFRERGIQVMTSAGVERLEPLQAGVRMVAACMAAGMRIEEVAELQFAFPTFTEGVSQAAQMLVRELGVRPMPSSGAASAHHRRRARGDGRGGGVHDRPAPARRRGPLGRPPRRAAAGGHHGRARLPRPVGDDGALVPVGSGVCAR